MNKQKQHEMIEQYMPFAINQAKLFTLRYNIDYLLDDFVSLAYIGLCKAAKKFRKKHQISFPQFASIYIMGSMFDEFRKMDMLTRLERKRRISGEEVNKYELVSLSEPIQFSKEHNEETFNLGDMIPSNCLSLDDTLDRLYYLQQVKDAVAKLPKVERIIMCLHMMNNYINYRDIGIVVGLCESRVAQLLHKAREFVKGEIDGTNQRIEEQNTI
jgi:RNA polymerase sigma factor (sigma-70 family)